jgi:hypothetical protein
VTVPAPQRGSGASPVEAVKAIRNYVPSATIGAAALVPVIAAFATMLWLRAGETWIPLEANAAGGREVATSIEWIGDGTALLVGTASGTVVRVSGNGVQRSGSGKNASSAIFAVHGTKANGAGGNPCPDLAAFSAGPEEGAASYVIGSFSRSAELSPASNEITSQTCGQYQSKLSQFAVDELGDVYYALPEGQGAFGEVAVTLADKSTERFSGGPVTVIAGLPDGGVIGRASGEVELFGPTAQRVIARRLLRFGGPTTVKGGTSTGERIEHLVAARGTTVAAPTLAIMTASGRLFVAGTESSEADPVDFGVVANESFLGGAFARMEFSNDGETLLLRRLDGRLALMRAIQLDKSPPPAQPVVSLPERLAPSQGPPGDASAEAKPTARWELLTLSLGASLGVLDAALSADGKTLAIAASDNSIRILDVSTAFFDNGHATEIAEINGHPDLRAAMSLSQDGTRLAVADLDGKLSITDLTFARMVWSLEWPLRLMRPATPIHTEKFESIAVPAGHTADPSPNPPSWNPQVQQAWSPQVQQAWSPQEQQAFYTADQGSRIIPILWFLALKKADGSALFAADGLARYGYLANPKSATNPSGLPVGFMVANDIAAYGGRPTLAMNCAACHTREITIEGRPVRIDGGPAIADFYGFLRDLDAAIQVVVSGGGFGDFAHRVLGSKYSATAAAALKVEVEAWYAEYGSFIKAALPDQSWGPIRLDAFGMIFNRVSGLDLGLPQNIRKADAPVRYPFLWNASRQDKTQWNGVAENGLYTMAMGRNLGEVYGVFGRFKPSRNVLLPDFVNFAGRNNSTNFHNLQQLETLIAKLPAPRYPLPIDPALATRGQALFVSEQCMNCHWPVPGRFKNTWKTPLTAENTDSRMFVNAQAKVKAIGSLEGVTMPQQFGPKPLTADAGQIDVLSTSVGNTLLEQLTLDPDGVLEAIRADLRTLTIPQATSTPRTAAIPTAGVAPQFLQSQMRDLYRLVGLDQRGAAYEARVLSGIWAAAPYLHNGSVPNLWALLQKPADRPKKFMLGSKEFDPKNVGLDTTTSPFNFTYLATPCDMINDGNSNCGHNWGTNLSNDDKWALIEYMKQL